MCTRTTVGRVSAGWQLLSANWVMYDVHSNTKCNLVQQVQGTCTCKGYARGDVHV